METPTNDINYIAFNRALSDLKARGWRLQPVSQIKEGKTNDSFMVSQRTQWYVLRVNNVGGAELGIDRALEQRIMQQLPKGIGLPVLEHTEHYMLSEFVRARTQPLSAPEFASFMPLLREVHSIDLGDPAIDYLARIRFLLPEQCHSSWSSILLRLGEAMQRADESYGTHRALCHHDLVPENILWSKDESHHTPWIIDWEYAAMGDVFFDLASVVENHAIPDRRHGTVLQAYGLPLDSVHKLRVYRAVYAAIVAAWELRSGVSPARGIDYIETLLGKY